MDSTTVIALSQKPRAGISGAKQSKAAPEEIATRAYEIFLLRGASHGRDVDDWLKAERELLERN